MAKKENPDVFYGRLIWGTITGFERDQPAPNAERFRSWEELPEIERDLYTFVGASMINYFRNSEGNEKLRQELADVKGQLETIHRAYLKTWKENGGR
jgi:hypothetical protein